MGYRYASRRTIVARMNKRLVFSFSFAASVAFAAACSSSSTTVNPVTANDSGAGTDSTAPASDGSTTGSSATITITSPTAGASVDYSVMNTDVDVSFTVTGLTLKDPGTCAGAAGCGFVAVFVDGTTCNNVEDPKNPQPYNGTASSSPTTAGLDYCPTFPALSASHTLSLELHNDDGTPLLGADGKVISASVMFTTNQVADDGGTDAGPG
jgi:hypothetical protein